MDLPTGHRGRLAELGRNAERLISRINGPLLDFWKSGGSAPPQTSLEAHCDVMYSLVLSGQSELVSLDSAIALAQLLNKKNLPGFVPEAGRESVSVHNFAYVLGAFNLFGAAKTQLYETALLGKVPHLTSLVDPRTNLPVFPMKWAHHSWRVSHWIGGVPSIVLSLARSRSSLSEPFESAFAPLRDATDGLINAQTGLLKAYNSEILQAVFRKLYALRHDPKLGDVGGIAHLLWIDHATGRAYVGLNALYQRSSELFLRRAPFMEAVPYCLDFDIVQIVRTAGEQLGFREANVTERAAQMMIDIEAFFAGKVPDAYTLHKVPGALATYHECGRVVQVEEVGAIYCDIIGTSFWI